MRTSNRFLRYWIGPSLGSDGATVNSGRLVCLYLGANAAGAVFAL